MQISLTTKRAYRYLWLVQVTGFDPQKHCYYCFKGKRCQLIPHAKQGHPFPSGYHVEGTLDPLAAPYGYLCGVAVTGYAHNLHVAWKPGNDIIQVDDAAVTLTITGAERIDIQPLSATLQATLPQSYSRCRNYQFGAQVFGLADTFRLGDLHLSDQLKLL